MNIRRSVHATGLGLCLGALAGVLLLTAWGRDVEQDLGLGWLFALRGARAAPADVVVAAIDHDASRRLGLPGDPAKWPRRLHARLVSRLAQAGASVVAFDLFFGEPQADDEAFAAAMRAAENVVLAAFVRRHIVRAGDTSAIVDELLSAAPPLASAAHAIAPFPLPKSSARVDGFWPRVEPQDAPTLPVAALAVHRARRGGTAIGADDADAFTYLDFYGPPRTIRTLAYDALIGDGPPASLDLRGKAVFVGFSESSQPEQKDNYYTVFSDANGLDLSGVEIAATAFANMLEQRRLRPLDAGPALALLVAWGLVIAWTCDLLRPAAAAGALVVLVGVYVGVAVHQFSSAALWWPLVVPLCVEAPLGFAWSAALKHYRAQTEREHLRRAFQHYLPVDVVDELAHEVGAVASRQKRVYGTCLATDLEGFTSVSEHMDPVELGELMNAYYRILFGPVERNGGFVSDVKGDAMLAIWATPKPDQALAERACNAALDIGTALVEFERTSGHRLRTRIGLDCGAMALGSIGATHHYEYTAMGDMVNTAHRIEALSKRLGTYVLASRAVATSTRAHLVRGVGDFVLHGRTSPTAVYEIMSRLDEASVEQRALCADFERALALYRGGDRAAAASAFRTILDRVPADGPSRFYVALCERADSEQIRSDAHGVVHLLEK